MAFKVRDRARRLRAEVKARIYPALAARGFERLRHTSLHGGFARIDGDSIDLIELQWDKHHRPCFVVNFGRTPLERDADGGVGVHQRWPRVWVPLAELSAGQLWRWYRLHDGRRRWERWFRLGLIDGLLRRNGEARPVGRCLERLELVHGWFAGDPECRRQVAKMNRTSDAPRLPDQP